MINRRLLTGVQTRQMRSTGKTYFFLVLKVVMRKAITIP